MCACKCTGTVNLKNRCYAFAHALHTIFHTMGVRVCVWCVWFSKAKTNERSHRFSGSQCTTFEYATSEYLRPILIRLECVQFNQEGIMPLWLLLLLLSSSFLLLLLSLARLALVNNVLGPIGWPIACTARLLQPLPPSLPPAAPPPTTWLLVSLVWHFSIGCFVFWYCRQRFVTQVHAFGYEFGHIASSAV